MGGGKGPTLNNLLLISNHPQMLYKIGVPKYFAKFTGRHLCKSVCFIKFQLGQLYQKGVSGKDISL